MADVPLPIQSAVTRSQSPADIAAESGYGDAGLEAGSSDQTITAGNFGLFSIIDSGDSAGQRMLVSSCEVTNDAYADSIGLRFTIEDSDSNQLYQAAGNIGNWPFVFRANPIVPTGGAAVFRVTNPTASDVDVRLAHVWRTK